MTDPLSRRLLQLAGLLSVLLIAVVVNYLLHDGGEALNPIAEAAQRTAAMPGARLKLEITYSAEGASKSVVGTGDGVYNARTGRTDAQFSLRGADGKSVWGEVVGDDRTVYTRSSALESALPPGKLWLAMEPLLGHSPQNALGSGAGAEGTLEELRAVGGDVEALDHQLVRGRRTTRYKATIDPSRVAVAASEHGKADLAREFEALAELEPDPIPVEVWVDDHGLARLIRMVEQLPSASGGPTVTMDTRMEFFDFGIHPKVPLPPKHRVFDYTPVLRAELGLEDGHAFGPLGPPAGTKPLSTATFRRRAGRICRRTYGEARDLLPEEQGALRALGRLDRAAVEAGAAKPILGTLGRWLEGPVLRLWRRQFRQLAALAPPPGDAPDYRRLLRLEAQNTEWAIAEARVFGLGIGKVPNTDGHDAEEKRQKAERKRLAASLGISICQQDLTGSDAQPA